MNKLEKIAELSKKASRVLSTTSSKVKSNVLKYAAVQVKKNAQKIENANKKDLKIAKSKGLDDAMIDRLLLDKSRKIIKTWKNVKVKDHAKEVLNTLKSIR